MADLQNQGQGDLLDDETFNEIISTIEGNTHGSFDTMYAPAPMLPPLAPNMSPYMVVSDQPQPKGFRFRYKCEGPSHGGLQAVSSKKGRKTYPAVEIYNYSGPVTMTISLVAADDPMYRPHVHELVGKNCGDKGIYRCDLDSSENMRFEFTNLCIQNNTKKNMMATLQQRIRQQFQLQHQTVNEREIERMAEEEAKLIKLNIVVLKFEACIPITGQCLIAYSTPISDSKNPTCATLRIARLSITSACCAGGDEIFILCDKVQRDDISVRVYEEDDDGNLKWQKDGEFNPTDVHRQFAIVSRLPAFRDTLIQEPVNVFIQLLRPSNGETSDPLPFTYRPRNTGQEEIKRKRAKPYPGNFGDRGGGPPGGGRGPPGGGPPGGGGGHGFGHGGGFNGDMGGGGGSMGGGLGGGRMAGGMGGGGGMPYQSYAPTFEMNNYTILQDTKQNYQLPVVETMIPPQVLMEDDSSSRQHSPAYSQFGAPQQVQWPPFGQNPGQNPFNEVGPVANLQIGGYRSEFDISGAAAPVVMMQDPDQLPFVGGTGPYGPQRVKEECHIDGAEEDTLETDCAPDYTTVIPSVTDQQQRHGSGRVESGYKSTDTDIFKSSGRTDSGLCKSVGSGYVCPSGDSGFGSTTATNPASLREKWMKEEEKLIAAQREAAKEMEIAKQERRKASVLASEAQNMKNQAFFGLFQYAVSGNVGWSLHVYRNFIHVFDCYGDNILQVSIIHGQREAFRHLMSVVDTIPNNGPIVDHRNCLRQTPLHMAVIMNEPSMVESLLKSGADYMAQDDAGNTPWHIAILEKRALCIEALARFARPGQPMDSRNYEGYTPLHIAAAKGLKMEFVECLSKAIMATELPKLSVGKPGLVNRSATVIETSKLNTASLAVNKPDGKTGRSPLHHAVLRGDAVMASYFVAELGADADMPDYDGNTPLHHACSLGHEALTALLVAWGADPLAENCVDIMDDGDDEETLESDKICVDGSDSEGVKSIREPGEGDDEEKLVTGHTPFDLAWEHERVSSLLLGEKYGPAAGAVTSVLDSTAAKLDRSSARDLSEHLGRLSLSAEPGDFELVGKDTKEKLADVLNSEPKKAWKQVAEKLGLKSMVKPISLMSNPALMMLLQFEAGEGTTKQLLTTLESLDLTECAGILLDSPWALSTWGPVPRGKCGSKREEEITTKTVSPNQRRR